MFAEIEELFFAALKAFIAKPEIMAQELQLAYAIYRDLRGIKDGETQSGNTQ